MADLDAMATFVAVVRMDGFRGAATSTHIPRSTVSQRVARLEEQLGVRLLERTARKLRMTDVGQAYFDRCVRILADVGEANLSVSSSHSAPQGTIRVACSLLFGHVYMTKLAADFMRIYPGVDVEIVATNRRVDVIEEGFDLAVVFMDPSEDSGLIARKLHGTELRCCASPAYFAARGVPLEPESVTSRGEPAYDLALRAFGESSISAHSRSPVRKLPRHGPSGRQERHRDRRASEFSLRRGRARGPSRVRPRGLEYRSNRDARRLSKQSLPRSARTPLRRSACCWIQQCLREPHGR
jgi:DNA-binding transcriptional LysR family regulator